MKDEIYGRFCKGIDLFNNHFFYECHDILEDVWFDVRGTSRRFYQGLIHLAVGFYHITVRENSKGAISQLGKGLEKLSEYKPEFQGVELEKLLKLISEIIQEIKKVKAAEFDKAKIPRLQFEPKMFKEP